MSDLIADMQNKVSELIAEAKEPLVARIARLEAQVLQLKDEVGDEWARAEQAIERNAALAAENAHLLTRITQLREYRDQMLELTHRAEQAEAELAERDGMLHSAWWEKWRNLQGEDEWMEDMRAGAKADLRARATAPDPKHACYLCHQPIQPNQESYKWGPGYRHFECPARAEEGAE